MRIVAGKYKGRKLDEPKDYSIRPTSDMTRQALFNILQWRIQGADVLDLFAGTGAVGLESLSRGANSLVACDNSRQSAALVASNMQKVGEKPLVLVGDWQDCLARLSGKNFDFIFLDPPYKMEIAPVLQALRQGGFCRQGGLVVYEHESNLPFSPIAGWRVFDCRKYGRAALTFLQAEE